jgi:hypothetical protein
LKSDVGPDGNLNVYQNGAIGYTICGVSAKVSALWRFEAPPGGGDTHYSKLTGTRGALIIQQGEAEHYLPTLYVENNSKDAAADFEGKLTAAVERLNGTWPGLRVKQNGARWEVTVPDKYRVGHEAHFAQVTEEYLRFLAEGKMPDWVVPNMLAKYYTTTEAWKLAHAK